MLPECGEKSFGQFVKTRRKPFLPNLFGSYDVGVTIVNPDPHNVVKALHIWYAYDDRTVFRREIEVHIRPENNRQKAIDELKAYGINTDCRNLDGVVINITTASTDTKLSDNLMALRKCLTKNNTRLGDIMVDAVEKIMQRESVDFNELNSQLARFPKLFTGTQKPWAHYADR